MKIYTKKGDKGKTRLTNGKELLKSDCNVEVLGAIDELNSLLGVLNSILDNINVCKIIKSIQRDLFYIGSVLSGFKNTRRIDLRDRTLFLESEIDKMTSDLPKLNNFILPGGSFQSSLIHFTRSVCRRSERRVVGFLEEKKTKSLEIEYIITYLNRLSDFLFTLARWVNYKQGVREEAVGVE